MRSANCISNCRTKCFFPDSSRKSPIFPPHRAARTCVNIGRISAWETRPHPPFFFRAISASVRVVPKPPARAPPSHRAAADAVLHSRGSRCRPFSRPNPPSPRSVPPVLRAPSEPHSPAVIIQDLSSRSSQSPPASCRPCHSIPAPPGHRPSIHNQQPPEHIGLM